MFSSVQFCIFAFVSIEPFPPEIIPHRFSLLFFYWRENAGRGYNMCCLRLVGDVFY